MRPIGRRLLASLLLASACASPDAAYYTLTPVSGRPASGGPATVELRRIGIAGYLDRPEIVRTEAGNRLRLDRGARWGEPLAALIGRVLVENLMQRLPGSNVFLEGGAVTSEGEAVVEINVQRFDADSANELVLLAQVALRPGRGRGASGQRSLRIAVPVAGSNVTELAAAMSAALGQLADAIAEMLRGGRPASRRV